MFINILIISILLANIINIKALNSRDLFYAYNHALIKSLEEGAIAQLEIKYSHMDVKDVVTCYPNSSAYELPRADKATGSLKEVLETGILKVGGLKFNTSDGDYISNPPKGFLPDYMRMIVNQLNVLYNRKDNNPIQIEWDYTNALTYVEEGKVHLSDVYYYTTSTFGSAATYKFFSLSCTCFAYESKFTVANDGKGINILYRLIGYLKVNPGTYTIAALSTGDFDASLSVLPKSCTYKYVNCVTYEDVISRLKDGTAFIGYTSGKPNVDPKEYYVFDSSIVSPRSSLFRRIDKE